MEIVVVRKINATGTEKDLLTKFMNYHEEYMMARKDFMELIDANKYDEAQMAFEMVTESRNKTFDSINQIIESNLQEAENANNTNNSIFKNSFNLMFGIVIFGFIFAILLGVLISTLLSKQINKVLVFADSHLLSLVLVIIGLVSYMFLSKKSKDHMNILSENKINLVTMICYLIGLIIMSILIFYFVQG